MRRICFSGLLFVMMLIVPRAFGDDARQGFEKLLGQPAAEWQVGSWHNSEPRQLADLKGKVVLVRFWTAPGCPYCAASAPALNEFYETYQDQGLEVFGFYHHKIIAPLRIEFIDSYADQFGFQFPVAVDYDWKTLKSWWLDQGDFAWTSITFLIDKQGIIRYIHPGGSYVKGDEDYRELKNTIERLLQEPPSQEAAS